MKKKRLPIPVAAPRVPPLPSFYVAEGGPGTRYSDERLLLDPHEKGTRGSTVSSYFYLFLFFILSMPCLFPIQFILTSPSLPLPSPSPGPTSHIWCSSNCASHRMHSTGGCLAWLMGMDFSSSLLHVTSCQVFICREKNVALNFH